MTNEKVIYSKWLANRLTSMGFIPLRVEQNPKRPNLYCWVFENGLEFQRAFTIAVNKQ